MTTSTAAALRDRILNHPGRGGCGVGAIAELKGPPSHELVELALKGLECLEHRGGTIDDTGDGSGLILATDQEYFARFIAPGRKLPAGQHLSVGVLFFPPGQSSNQPHWHGEIDGILRRHGLLPLGWRRVPTDDDVLGRHAHDTRREIWQVLVGEGMVRAEDLPLVLFRVKAALERQVRELYVASLSAHTLVYKALATGEQLRRYYPDLTDPALRTDAVVFHRRYSTNTFSNWFLAQPFRTLGHNGEINTIKANRNAAQNLEAELGMRSILMAQGSDSADMDRVVELFASHGVPLPETLCRLMPPAYRDLPALAPEAKRFFQGVQRALGTLGAWEGPAAIVALDGRYLVGSLDRMGLRPLRYATTHSGRFLLGSEIGALPLAFEDIAHVGQLDPGEAVAVDRVARKVLSPTELMAQVVSSSKINFGDLSETNLVQIPHGDVPPAGRPDPSALNLFGWTLSRIRNVEHVAENGKEPITSMGYDRPLAVLSAHRPTLTKYFKQIVAVVTNPPIDPLREAGAFDLTVHLGSSPTAKEDAPSYDPLPQYRHPSPFLTSAQLAAIQQRNEPSAPRALVLDATFVDPGSGAVNGAKAISRRISELVGDALAQVKRREASLLILSDRAVLSGPSDARMRLPVPVLLLTSALHNALVGEGLRRHASIIVDTGEVQEGHDAAVLIANGATAICPYLYLALGKTAAAEQNLVAGLVESLRRIMSKMGICSVDGYRGSRLFEATGLSPALVEHYLPGIASHLGGLELEDLYEDLRARDALGGTAQRELDVSVYRKEVWQELQRVARGHDPEAYGRFLRLLAETPPVYLRDLLVLRGAGTPLAVEEVEAEDALVAHCFRGAAMSLGALHRTAHEAIAAAFNDLGAMSNCGEGGEDPARDPGGARAHSRSRIRQVASGRFGVDARYLGFADELSIKIGQGAKPGEGGMLPAGKVTAEIARIRRTQAGVALISPPPHHDIYSIEDLAQLVYNLRQVNPRARISVKIPGVTDIGTIAVGVAKAGADIIDVSGMEGGTGAATASSIEHAGLPLERALSETHQALVLSGVRDRVRVRADGGLKTGFDIAVALALGADEVSLGTALMIAEQCIFCHGCANGMCPAGITTQSDLIARRLMTEKKGRPKDDKLPDEELARYDDARNAVTRYLRTVARELRGHLARLGLRSARQLVGRVDLLERRALEQAPWPDAHKAWIVDRAAKLDLAELLTPVGVDRDPESPPFRLPVDPTGPMNAELCDVARNEAVLRRPLRNTDRAIGATLAGQIATGRLKVPEGGFRLEFEGYAGQALGFACVDGLRIELTGFANDTVGEVMSGGTIVIKGPRELPAEVRGTLSLCGNAAAYGATGGRLFVEGRAGQRVGVRNSGATLVVEGAGKYAFEYMTGGIGVVLGTIGPVVASGMTGGVVYVLGADGTLADKIHPDARLRALEPPDEPVLRALIEAHLQETGSATAQRLLSTWGDCVPRFMAIVPK